MWSRKSFSTRSFSPKSWKFSGGPHDDDTKRPDIFPGACFPFGSSDELIRVRRRKKRRESDLVFLGL